MQNEQVRGTEIERKKRKVYVYGYKGTIWS